mmetsp:Transcript_67536/g.206828  ORF Transcript_67536/g.206828 Transcript_67536/m.206828 type:complete len:560 (-) Transcript_67536:837-2516(-)
MRLEVADKLRRVGRTFRKCPGVSLGGAHPLPAQRQLPLALVPGREHGRRAGHAEVAAQLQKPARAAARGLDLRHGLETRHCLRRTHIERLRRCDERVVLPGERHVQSTLLRRLVHGDDLLLLVQGGQLGRVPAHERVQPLLRHLPRGLAAALLRRSSRKLHAQEPSGLSDLRQRLARRRPREAPLVVAVEELDGDLRRRIPTEQLVELVAHDTPPPEGLQRREVRPGAQQRALLRRRGPTSRGGARGGVRGIRLRRLRRLRPLLWHVGDLLLPLKAPPLAGTILGLRARETFGSLLPNGVRPSAGRLAGGSPPGRLLRGRGVQRGLRRVQGLHRRDRLRGGDRPVWPALGPSRQRLERAAVRSGPVRRRLWRRAPARGAACLPDVLPCRQAGQHEAGLLGPRDLLEAAEVRRRVKQPVRGHDDVGFAEVIDRQTFQLGARRDRKDLEGVACELPDFGKPLRMQVRRHENEGGPRRDKASKGGRDAGQRVLQRAIHQADGASGLSVPDGVREHAALHALVIAAQAPLEAPVRGVRARCSLAELRDEGLPPTLFLCDHPAQ